VESGGICWVHRIERDDLVPRPSNAQGRRKQRVLSSRQEHDVLSLRALTRALRVRSGNRLPNFPSAGSRAVVRVTGLYALNRFGYYSRRRLQIGVAYTQNDDVFAAIARCRRLVVGHPGVGAFTADPFDKWRELHVKRSCLLCIQGCIFDHI